MYIAKIYNKKIQSCNQLIFKDKLPISLVELKDKSGLSNKKWDVSIKGLTKHKLAQVTKIGDDLIVEMV